MFTAALYSKSAIIIINSAISPFGDSRCDLRSRIKVAAAITYFFEV